MADFKKAFKILVFQILQNEDKKILKDDKTRQRGTIIAFPSFAYHRVTKVTRGERLSIVIWYKGDVWK